MHAEILSNMARAIARARKALAEAEHAAEVWVEDISVPEQTGILTDEHPVLKARAQALLDKIRRARADLESLSVP